MEGSLSAHWMTCLGFRWRYDHVAKVVQSQMANYFQIFPPLVFSYRLFIFTNRGNFQVRTWVWRKFAAESHVNFQRGDWTGVKWSSQSRETNFLTLPDLAFGFVHKKSGNEIRPLLHVMAGISARFWNFAFVLLYNKSLNDWSLGEQWTVNSLFPSGPVIKC